MGRKIGNPKLSEHGSKIKILPEKALFDQKVKIRLLGFKPNQLVTVRASTKDDTDKKWVSYATFKANADGVVDLNSQKPLSGTYDGVDPMGLFWSMGVSPEEKEISMYLKRTLAPSTITFTAEADGKVVASANLERSLMALGVKRTPVREGGLVGTFFHPAEPGPRPGIIVLSGSDGGAYEHVAGLLASHGYPAFALAYFNMENLPTELGNIPLEYIEKGIQWMKAQMAVDGKKLALMGWSRGGELALLVGATFPEIKLVIAFVPSHVVWSGLPRNCESWTYHGKPVPYVPNRSTGSDGVDFEQRIRGGVPIRITPNFLRSMEDEAVVEKATIPVERIKGPVLLISGEDDQMWPSTLFSKLVTMRLKKHKHPHLYKHISYKGAGHMITPGHTPRTFTVSRHPVMGASYELGGNAADGAFASSDSWSKALRFLKENLRQS